MKLARLIQSLAARRHYRVAVRELAALDDRTLRDIGLNRAQIESVAFHGGR